MGFLDDIADVVLPLLRAADAPGAAIGLAIDGHRTSAGIGFRDLNRAHPLGDGEQFYLYSMTKTLVAIATLRMVERDLVALDHPIRRVLPELVTDERITLRQLLNHTAGVPDYGALPEYNRDLTADPSAAWTTDQFLDQTMGRGLIFPPGEGWAYSNAGYLLARLAVERLTGGSLGAALTNLVFAPLRLRQTTVAESLTDAQALTPGFSASLDGDGQLRDITKRYHPGWVAHGVAISTASEATLVFDGLCTGQLLTPESFAVIQEAVKVPGLHPPFVRPGYGLGLMVDLDSPWGKVTGHAGGGPGYSTASFHFPDVAGRRVTATALVNRDCPGLGQMIVFALAELVAR